MEGPDRPYLTKAQRRDLEWPRQEKTRGRVHADKVKVVFYGRLIASTRWLEEKHPTSSDLIEVFHGERGRYIACWEASQNGSYVTAYDSFDALAADDQKRPEWPRLMAMARKAQHCDSDELTL